MSQKLSQDFFEKVQFIFFYAGLLFAALACHYWRRTAYVQGNIIRVRPPEIIQETGFFVVPWRT
jgi:hypothetical protein